MLALWQINSRNSPLTAEAKNVYFHGHLTDVAGMIVHLILLKCSMAIPVVRAALIAKWYHTRL